MYYHNCDAWIDSVYFVLSSYELAYCVVQFINRSSVTQSYPGMTSITGISQQLGGSSSTSRSGDTYSINSVHSSIMLNVSKYRRNLFLYYCTYGHQAYIMIISINDLISSSPNYHKLS